MYEYGTLKPVEVILRRVERRGRIVEGMNQMRVQCTHISNYHDEIPCTTIT
jgi:hypothetical protein